MSGKEYITITKPAEEHICSYCRKPVRYIWRGNIARLVDAIPTDIVIRAGGKVFLRADGTKVMGSRFRFSEAGDLIERRVYEPHNCRGGRNNG